MGERLAGNTEFKRAAGKKEGKRLESLKPWLRYAVAAAVLAPYLQFNQPAPAAAQENSSSHNNHIVVLKEGFRSSQSEVIRDAQNHGVDVSHVFSRALNGYSGNIPSDRLAEIKSDPKVQMVVEDRVVALPHEEIKQVSRATRRTSESQPDFPQVIPLGLQRIGGNNRHIPGNKDRRVGVAVLDTGVEISHSDLAANIGAEGINCTTEQGEDKNGHGTMVAGIIAALDNDIGIKGVAPDATIYNVKVLDASGTGYVSAIICGLDWVVANKELYNLLIANLSLTTYGKDDKSCGITDNDVFHMAICRVYNNGIVVVGAAGNSASSIRDIAPSGYHETISVSALDDNNGIPGDDDFPVYSNYDGVKIAAPDMALSTFLNNWYATLKGTSMSAAYVSGAVALLLSKEPNFTPDQAERYLVARGEQEGHGHIDSTGLHPEPVLLIGYRVLLPVLGVRG